MKTLNLNLYAVPVALLVMAGGLANQTASADATGQSRTFEARLVYNATDPAEQIYADLRRGAVNACTDTGPRRLGMRVHEQQCAEELVAAAVERISRPDLAAVHARVLNG